MILSIFKFSRLSFWRLGSADAWPAWNKMLCMDSYMPHCTHLHDRYDKSDFFSSDFISLLSCFLGISAKLSKQYYLKFPDKYPYHIQVGSFRDCLRNELQKCPPPFHPKNTYPTMVKLSTVIPYLTKIQIRYKSRGTPL